MMIFNAIILCFSYSLLADTFAQQPAEEISTDRPDQTESAVAVPTRSLQIETGFLYERFKENNFKTEQISLAGTLFRYGLFENFELRFGTGYLISKADKTISGLGDFLLGGKINFLKEESDPVDFGMLIQTSLPIGDKAINPIKFEPELIAALSKSISEKFSISANFGGYYDYLIEEIIYIYTLSLSFSFTNKFSSFIEAYGNLAPSFSPMHNRDAGLTYLLDDNFQVDLSGGIRLLGYDSYWFFGTGVSVRINNL